jgi:hypothetical protein
VSTTPLAGCRCRPYRGRNGEILHLVNAMAFASLCVGRYFPQVKIVSLRVSVTKLKKITDLKLYILYIANFMII